jgi:NAD(P)H-hydrate repair Nnr-like enzyme with NAD(P)H-hydrate dehydratase domain
VLTPHMGEFARLFPDIAARLAEPPMRGPAMSRIDAARAAALRAGCTVLLTGPDTVVATALGPDAARADVHSANYDRAAPWLATAGAGDVLAGMIAGLLARGAAPHDAACRAAWLHARAARLFGPGLIAEDLPDMIPRALRPLMA